MFAGTIHLFAVRWHARKALAPATFLLLGLGATRSAQGQFTFGSNSSYQEYVSLVNPQDNQQTQLPQSTGTSANLTPVTADYVNAIAPSAQHASSSLSGGYDGAFTIAMNGATSATQTYPAGAAFGDYTIFATFQSQAYFTLTSTAMYELSGSLLATVTNGSSSDATSSVRLARQNGTGSSYTTVVMTSIAGSQPFDFTGSLTPGNYRITYDNETNPYESGVTISSTGNYRFTVAVPEPSTWALTGLAGAGLGLAALPRRRRVA